MKRTMTGGCQCGAVRYEIEAEPLTLYVCHCTECQRQSSSAFGMSMRLPRSAVKITKGALKEWCRRADSGREESCRFCADCGTRLFHGTSLGSEYVNLKPGTLDDTSRLRPAGHLWTKSAQPWVEIGHELLVYEGQPEDFSPLIQRWQERHGEGRS